MLSIKDISSIIEVEHLQRMFENFFKLTKLSITLSLPNGEPLKRSNGCVLSAGQQNVCINYHRKIKSSSVRCEVSDSYLAKQVLNGKEHCVYKCLNGLVNVVVPVYYENQIVASLYINQFFLNKPDLNFFVRNARLHGYNEKAYMDAVNQVSIITEEKMNDAIEYMKSLSKLISCFIEEKKSDREPNRWFEVTNEIACKVQHHNEIITSTVLSLDGYIYSLDNRQHFEDYVGPFKIGFFGETTEALKGQHYTKIVNENILTDLKEAIVRTYSSGDTSKFIFSQEKKYYHASLIMRFDYWGKPVGTTLHIKEVTKEIDALYKVEKLTVAAEQSPHSIVIVDSYGLIEYVNSAFEKITGYTKKEAIGKNPRILKSGMLKKEVYENLWATIKNGEVWKGELINRKKDGSLYWENSAISPVVINGKIEYYVAIKKDITERKRMEKTLHNYKRHLEKKVVMRTKELRESYKNYKEIVEHLTGIIWEVDFKGCIRYVSPNVSRYSDFEDKDLIGKPISKLFPSELHELLYDFVKQFSVNPEEFSDFEVFMDKGTKRTYLKASGRPLYEMDGDCNKLVGIRGISIDFTQQKEKDKEILAAIWDAEEKHKAFIAMELHDSVGSSLSAASIYSNAAVKMYNDDQTIIKIDQIIKMTAREVRLVARQLRPPELEKLGLEGGLANLKRLFEESGQVNIDIRTSIYNAMLLPQLELAAYRIISELINNSIKHGKADEITINVFTYAGHLYVIFTDNGNGNLKINEEGVVIGEGTGIKNVLNRVKLFEGICNFFSVPEQGLVVGIEMLYEGRCK